MGRISELIKSFINPVEPEKSFDELAADAGIKEADLKMLKKSIGGVSWDFEDEVEEETKKGKSKNAQKVSKQEVQVQPAQKNVAKNDVEIERD